MPPAARGAGSLPFRALLRLRGLGVAEPAPSNVTCVKPLKEVGAPYAFSVMSSGRALHLRGLPVRKCRRSWRVGRRVRKRRGRVLPTRGWGAAGPGGAAGGRCVCVRAGRIPQPGRRPRAGPSRCRLGEWFHRECQYRAQAAPSPPAEGAGGGGRWRGLAAGPGARPAEGWALLRTGEVRAGLWHPVPTQSTSLVDYYIPLQTQSSFLTGAEKQRFRAGSFLRWEPQWLAEGVTVKAALWCV